jgi:hypothetical protein
VVGGEVVIGSGIWSSASKMELSIVSVHTLLFFLGYKKLTGELDILGYGSLWYTVENGALFESKLPGINELILKKQ